MPARSSATCLAALLVALPAAAQQPPAPGARPPAAATAGTADPLAATTAAPSAEPQAATTAVPAAPPVSDEPSRMVSLLGGSFRGAERVGVNLDVAFYRVNAFSLDATEVTVAQFGACVRAKRCAPAGKDISTEGVSKKDQKKWSAACNGDKPDRANHPINCVDWSQASAYCAWAGKRLPTEEEWEWAARGASAEGIYPWGAEPPGDRACWSGGASAGEKQTGTCPVASHQRGDTPEGISDLAGNVWEWTATPDVLHPDSRGRGGAPANVARGGGWADTDAQNLTAGRRAKNRPQWRLADLGFRCAR